MDIKRQNHWDDVYTNKTSSEVSWTQETPTTSLDFIHSFGLKKTARIIDIGAGDSKFVDYLLDEGYENITVLDISAQAIAKAKARLGNRAQNIDWVVSDITNYSTEKKFDIWHDRATFHFLTSKEQIATYLDIARRTVTGFLTIGTFSTEGPEKCSGLEVKQYNEDLLAEELKNGFNKIRCITEDHITPFNTKQNFLFCSFKRAIS